MNKYLIAAKIAALSAIFLYFNNAQPFFFVFAEIALLVLAYAFLKHRLLKIALIPLMWISAAEFTSVIETGHFVDALTLNNFDSATYLGMTTLVAITLEGLFILALYVLPTRVKENTYVAITCLLVLLGAEYFSYSKAPITSFVTTFREARSELSAYQNLERGKPFLKTKVVEKSSYHNAATYGKNVILVFTEGMSRVVMSDSVTPNAAKLYKRSMAFTNYYNHTATTYRGIRSQLMSGFQRRGGWNKKFADEAPKDFNLITILKSKGYRTVFVTPDPDYDDEFYHYLTHLGFDLVVAHQKHVFSDRELYDSLYKEFDLRANSGQKFIIVTYIAGTHEGQNSKDQKFGDGKNPYLNKFYNQDFYLGKFLEKFDANPQSKDTIFVLATDHAAYPGREFKQTFGATTNIFCDQVPLSFYNQNIAPSLIDAGGKTSLALAPTILDVLGITDAPNHFLGHSLFDEAPRSPEENLFVMGNQCFEVNNGEFKELYFDYDCTNVARFYEYGG